MKPCCENRDSKFCPDCGSRIPAKDERDQIVRFIESHLHRTETKLETARRKLRELPSDYEHRENVVSVYEREIQNHTSSIAKLKGWIGWMKRCRAEGAAA